MIFAGFLGRTLRKILFLQLPFSAPSFGQIMALISVLGIAGLTYLYGAAVMYFQMPSYAYLDNAFGGAKAWLERGRSTIPPLSADAELAAKKREGIDVDEAGKTWDGFTLYVLSSGARAMLIDMRGKEVHRWQLPFSKAFTKPPHVEDPLPDEQIHWFHCYLYPNGDLLAVYHADGDTPYGYGLVKVDKDSKLLWAYANRCHHDVDVGADGTIYTLVQKLVNESQPRLESLPTPYLADSLIVLSPEGREIHNIPIGEAFVDSPYALLLQLENKFTDMNKGTAPFVPPLGVPPSVSASPGDQKNDIFHTNSVKVLNPKLASKFPLLQKGQVLLSIRNLNTIAVVDPPTRRVVWAAQGIWRLQHDAEFLENGHLLLYDNTGSSRQTRILEYDLKTQAIPWAYCNEDSPLFTAHFRGIKQRLPNNNTFIVDPDSRRLFEVTSDKKLVWQYFCPLPARGSDERARGHAVNGARRYGKDELTFLRGVANARP